MNRNLRPLAALLIASFLSPLAQGSEGLVVPEQLPVAIFCGTGQTSAQAAYQARVNAIRHFGNAATVAVAIPAAPAAILILAGGDGGDVTLDGGAAAVVGGGVLVAVGTYFGIRQFKRFKSRHFAEVIDNMKEADAPQALGTKKLQHTAELINKKIKEPGRYSATQVADALKAAQLNGSLCRDDKLLVTEDFRDAVLANLAH